MTGKGKVLVLGANGFIGGHVTTALGDAGHEVTGTSRSGDGATVTCDLLDPVSVKYAIETARPDAVVMAAGISSVKEAWDEPDRNFRVNVEGVFNLLEAMRTSAADIHLTVLSSASVYGAPPSPDALPFTEESPADPTSPYGASKLAGEVLARQYGRQYGFPVAVLRLFNQIGPGQGTGSMPSEFSRRVALAEARGERRLMLPVGNPESERDFTDVREAATGVAGVATTRTAGLFNLCSGESVSVAKIVHGLNLLTGVEIGMSVDPSQAHPEDVTELYGSGEKLEAATGWKPSAEIDYSLESLLDDWRGRVPATDPG